MNEIIRAGGTIAPVRIVNGTIPRHRILIRTFVTRFDLDRGCCSGIGYSSWGWKAHKPLDPY
jgi:hypothetical protein